MPSLIDAVLPYQPFPNPVAVPVSSPLDGDQVCIHANRDWMTYLGACALALLADSTWNSDDENTVQAVERNAYLLIRQFANPEVCPMPVQFRLNPSDSHYWDFSNDGGATWTRQPDTVVHFTPAFAVSAAPSGYSETVNGGLSYGDVPAMVATTATDAVITDPSADLRNLIAALPNTVEALAARVDTQIFFRLANGGVSALFEKILDPAVAAGDPVVQVNGMGSGAPLIEVNP